MSVSVGQMLKRRYRIDALIARGGLGAVYRAYDMALNYRCAVKENLNNTRAGQQQFQREAEILARLRHPNLPRVTDFVLASDGCQYLVMDFIEGRDLNKILERRGQPLTEQEILQPMIEVCQAVEYLHAQTPAIIHRDIKPHNIIITPRNKAMLVDFGIAKIYDPNINTASGANGLTRGFAPPEQYDTNDVRGHTDTRSDVYSLGATLYFLLTNQKLPDADNRRVHGLSFRPPRYFNQSLSVPVEQIILKAIQIQANQRCQSISQIRSVLAQSLSNKGRPTRQPQRHEVPHDLGIDQSPLWVKRGIDAFRQREYDHAIKCLEYAIDLNPDNMDAVQWLTQARLARKKGRRR